MHTGFAPLMPHAVTACMRACHGRMAMDILAGLLLSQISSHMLMVYLQSCVLLQSCCPALSCMATSTAPICMLGQPRHTQPSATTHVFKTSHGGWQPYAHRILPHPLALGRSMLHLSLAPNGTSTRAHAMRLPCGPGDRRHPITYCMAIHSLKNWDWKKRRSRSTFWSGSAEGRE